MHLYITDHFQKVLTLLHFNSINKPRKLRRQMSLATMTCSQSHQATGELGQEIPPLASKSNAPSFVRTLHLTSK